MGKQITFGHVATIFRGATFEWQGILQLLHHQTFERPSLGNLKKGSVPSAFVDCLEKALSRALSSRAQKELNLSSNYTRIPEKVVRKSADGLKYSEQTFAFLLLEI